jgi:hypothetical protein
MKTIIVTMLFGAVLISGSASADVYDFDVYGNTLVEAEAAATDQCVANHPGATRLQCGLVTCMQLQDGRVGCWVPDKPLTKEELAEMGYSEGDSPD